MDRKYTDGLKNTFISMMVSNDLGARFYDEKARPFLHKMIHFLTESSKYPLDKLSIVNDDNAYFMASFYNNFQTGEKKFYLNRHKMLNGFTSMNGDLTIENKLLSIYQSMLTANHEFRHYEQAYIEGVSKLDKLEPMAILFAKEAIIIREDNAFYKKNHDSFIKEIDANMHANNIIREFLNSLNHSTPNIERLQRTAKYYFEEAGNSRKMYTVRGGFCEEISSRLDNIIKNIPNSRRQMYFHSMPCLTFIYKNDGSKRTYHEIMQLKNKFITGKKQATLNKKEIDDFVNVVDSVFRVIIDFDKDLRKQRDDDIQSKKITQEKQREIENRIKQEEDAFGVSKSMIEQVQRENEQKQKKGFYKSR